MFSAVEEEGVGAADEPEGAEGEEVEEDEEDEEDEEGEESSEESSSSQESGAEDEGADDEGPEDEEEGEERVAALPISKEQQEAEEEDLGKVCLLNCCHSIIYAFGDSRQGLCTDGESEPTYLLLLLFCLPVRLLFS